MARNFADALARVWRICLELGVKNMPCSGFSKSLQIRQVYVDVKLGLQILSRSNLSPKLQPTSITFAL